MSNINSSFTVTVKNIPEKLELVTGSFQITSSGVPATNELVIDYSKIRNHEHFIRFMTFAFAQYQAEQVVNSKQN